MLDWRQRDRRFEPHRRHYIVSLSKNINPSLVLVQPRKTRPYITERLLMGRKESYQTNKTTINIRRELRSPTSAYVDNSYCQVKLTMHGSRKFCQRGSNFFFFFFFFFLVDEGWEDPSTTISGPSWARQRNAIKWRLTGVPMMPQH